MAEKILFVDDDPNILSGFQRTLRGRFQVETSPSAAKAFEMLKNDDSFAVVVSDYRMPNMNGVDFLAQSATLWPDRVRILLTGEADTRAAGAAVNQGQVFRFLMKPCPSLILERTLTAALKHHQLLHREKTVLEETLRGSMQVLVELLTFASPHAFRRSQMLYRTLRYLLADLPVEDKWEFELTGLLSEIGNVIVPAEILAKAADGLLLSPAEEKLYLSRLDFAERLLEKIPRLELVAKLIGAQGMPLPSLPSWQAIDQSGRFALGANLLALATCWNEFSSKGLPLAEFLVEARSLGFPTALLKAAEGSHFLSKPSQSRPIKISDLEVGMTLDSDLIADNGVLLLTKGQTLSSMLVECLHKRVEYYAVDEEVLIHTA